MRGKIDNFAVFDDWDAANVPTETITLRLRHVWFSAILGGNDRRQILQGLPNGCNIYTTAIAKNSASDTLTGQDVLNSLAPGDSFALI